MKYFMPTAAATLNCLLYLAQGAFKCFQCSRVFKQLQNITENCPFGVIFILSSNNFCLMLQGERTEITWRFMAVWKLNVIIQNKLSGHLIGGNVIIDWLHMHPYSCQSHIRTWCIFLKKTRLIWKLNYAYIYGSSYTCGILYDVWQLFTQQCIHY